MKTRSKRDTKKTYRYEPGNYNEVGYKEVRKIAMRIALETLNRHTAALLNICMMAYMDVMTDLKESHPNIDKAAIDPIRYRDKVESYIQDYDNGEFNQDQLKAYVGKYRVRKMWYADRSEKLP